MKLKTVKADMNVPTVIMIYGVEGVGKSTFGANADNPVFLCAEDGTSRLKNRKGEPVDVLPGIDSFSKVMEAVKALKEQEHDFKTLVLDSLDWIEKLAHISIIQQSNAKDIIRAAGGYGAGYRQSEAMHRMLISSLSELREKRKMHIVITAHAEVRQVKDPDLMEDYDGYQIKCHEFVSSLFREWSEAILFARFKTYVSSGDATQRARAVGSDERVVFTGKRPAFQAKNRFGLPHQMPLTPDLWWKINEYAKGGVKEETEEDVLADITEMKAKVDAATLEVVNESVEKAKGNLAQLKAIRTRLKQITEEKR